MRAIALIQYKTNTHSVNLLHLAMYSSSLNYDRFRLSQFSQLKTSSAHYLVTLALRCHKR